MHLLHMQSPNWSLSHLSTIAAATHSERPHGSASRLLVMVPEMCCGFQRLKEKQVAQYSHKAPGVYEPGDASMMLPALWWGRQVSSIRLCTCRETSLHLQAL